MGTFPNTRSAWAIRCGSRETAEMRFGQAIEGSLLQLRQSVERLQNRSEPCGLLLDIDEPLGYVGIPDEFRSFSPGVWTACMTGCGLMTRIRLIHPMS
jgi:hypothetical protein